MKSYAVYWMARPIPMTLGDLCNSHTSGKIEHIQLRYVYKRMETARGL